MKMFFKELKEEFFQITWPTTKEIKKQLFITLFGIFVIILLVFIGDYLGNLGIDEFLKFRTGMT